MPSKNVGHNAFLQANGEPDIQKYAVGVTCRYIAWTLKALHLGRGKQQSLRINP